MFKMSDSASFSSLLALVDNHLSKISTQENSESTTGDLSNRIQIPKLTHGNELFLFPTNQRISIPSLSENLTSVTINDVLAQQVSNMLKAKELKLQKEQQKLSEETRRNAGKADNCINLLEAIQTPYKYEKVEETVSSASSMESLFEQNFSDFEEEMLTKTSEPVLFCVTDLSYILQQKIARGKCSNFGKVLTSRIRATAAPYLRETVNNSVVKFDFNAPSPCDLVKERLRKPTSYNTCNFNILDMI